MLSHRPFHNLGHHHYGWLDARYHFSFGDYHHPERMGHGKIRVWNDDAIAAHTGFDRHPHRNMEIITYVRTGAITHRDSLGNEGRTEAGQVQVMSAGSGIQHEEQNMEDGETQLFQIWILPRETGGDPFWAQREFPKSARNGAFQVLASGRPQDAGSDALPIRQDAAVLGATLSVGQTVTYPLNKRPAYLVLATGAALVNGIQMGARDGLAIADEDQLDISVPAGAEDTEIVLVETA